MDTVTQLFDRIAPPELTIRNLNIAVNHVLPEEKAEKSRRSSGFEQLDLFTDYAGRDLEEEKQREELDRERRAQEAVLDLRQRFGKNAVLRGVNLQEGATAMERNSQIGGHKAESKDHPAVKGCQKAEKKKPDEGRSSKKEWSCGIGNGKWEATWMDRIKTEKKRFCGIFRMRCEKQQRRRRESTEI